MSHVRLSSVASHGLQFFSTLSHKGQDFREKKIIECIIYVLIFLPLLSETFLILRRNERDIIINMHKSLCKLLVILVRFY